MAQDYDDIVWMGHTCHSAVFASLAVAEHEGAGAARFLAAVVAANEVAGRLGASSFLGPLNGQMWTFIHLLGAAAATAQLLGLDAEHTTHALAIALAQPNFALQPGFLQPTSKLLAASTPTATGIQAAYFARAGMTGAPGLLEDPRGFWARFAFLPLPSMLEGLGERWVLDTLTVKTHPGCHYFQTALTALGRLQARNGALRLERVRKVRIDATQLACEATRFAEDAGAGALTPVTVCFDLGQAAAVFLAAGRLTPRELEPGWLAAHRPELSQWLERIEVRHDPALTARVLAGARGLPAGKLALGALSLKQVRALRRRYAAEYRSTLLSWADLWAAARGALRRDRPRDALAAGVPLYFPARVTIGFEHGARDSERVDLPEGSLASERFEAVLARKALAALPPAALEAAARLERAPLTELVAAFRS